MGSANPRLIAIDVETTGLDHRSDQLLEVGVIALDDHPTEIAHYHSLFPPFSLWEDFLAKLDPVVSEMHDKSGLLEALKDGRLAGTTTRTVDQDLSLFIAAHYGDDRPYLVGRNPAFDRAWLEFWLPETARRLHYRSFDVTVLGDLGDRNPSLGAPKAGRAHRALDDAREAAEILRWWREWSSAPIGTGNGE